MVDRSPSFGKDMSSRTRRQLHCDWMITMSSCFVDAGGAFGKELENAIVVVDFGLKHNMNDAKTQAK